MQREPKVFLEDIIEAAGKIERFISQMTYDEFIKDELVSDAVIKNILVIGEATKNVPKDVREKYPELEWRKMVGMRDMLINGYSSANYQIIWDVGKLRNIRR